MPFESIGRSRGTGGSSCSSLADTPVICRTILAGGPLPTPSPYIAPGRAITGMYAYMETRGTTTHTYTEPDTPFGPLTIVAKGRYFVDWGDGTHTGPHSAEGGPWPEVRSPRNTSTSAPTTWS